MAVAAPPSVLLSSASATPVTARTTGSFTPAANSLLLIAFRVQGTGAPPSPSISDTAGLSWSTQYDVTFNSSDRMTIARAIVGSSPGSMTITADYGAYSCAAQAWGLLNPTGGDLGTPVVSGSQVTGSGTGTGAATAAAPALANGGNIQLLFVASRSNAATAKVSPAWAELFDRVGNTNCHMAAYCIASPGDTAPQATLAGSALYRVVAFELAAAGTTAGTAKLASYLKRRRAA